MSARQEPGYEARGSTMCIVVRAKKEGDLWVVSGKIYSDVHLRSRMPFELTASQILCIYYMSSCDTCFFFSTHCEILNVEMYHCKYVVGMCMVDFICIENCNSTYSVCDELSIE